MKRLHLGTLIAAAALALAGCAALEVNVDVYKGPLIDPHRLRTEQLGAMAMGAKPLLLQLRSDVEYECRNLNEEVKAGKWKDRNMQELEDRRSELGCDHLSPPSVAAETKHSCKEGLDQEEVISEGCFNSWKARRVNAILGLYRPANRGSEKFRLALEKFRYLLDRGGQSTRAFMLAFIGKSTLEVRRAAAKGQLDAPAIDRFFGLEVQARLDELAAQPEKAKNPPDVAATARRLRDGPGKREDAGYRGSDVHAVQTELIKQIKDPAVSALLIDMRRKMLEAWKYGCGLLADQSLRDDAGADGVQLLAESVATLTGYYFLADFAGPGGRSVAGVNARTFPSELAELAKPQNEDRSLRVRTLAQALAGPGGPAVADALLRINAVLESEPDAHNPKDLSAQPGLVPFLNRVGAIRAQVAEQVQTAFGGGRRDVGIERLIENYLAAQDEYEVLQGEKRRTAFPELRGKRWRLLHALTDFAEKVVYMANFEVLLPGSSSGTGTEAGGKRASSRKPAQDSVRLLQAVGNSIMNQISDYKRWDEYDRRMLSSVPTQLWALRTSGDAIGDGALAELAAQISEDKRITDIERRAIVEKLKSGAGTLKQGTQRLQAFKEAEEKKLKVAESELKRDRDAKALVYAPAFKTALKAAADPKEASQRKNKIVASARKWLAERELEEAAATRNDVKDAARRVQGLLAANVATTLNVEKLLDGITKALVDTIEKSEKAAKDAGERRDLFTRWLSSAWAPGTSSAGLGQPKEPAFGWAESKQVLDALITGLQTQYVFETRAGLAERAKLTKQAIAAAQSYRTGMVFIRPAATFLRDSYPATILQDDPASRKDLLRLRTPFQHDTLTPDQRTQQVIDKQFWQTVNHVSLSGAGRTNYVLTKDDIGNWYVKGYSSDPGQIYSSARNLLLFAATAKHQAEALAGRELGGTKGALSTGSPYDRSLLKRQLESASTSYERDLRNSLLATRKAARDLQKNLRAAGKEEAPGGKEGLVDTIVGDPTDTAITDLKERSDDDLKPKDDSKRADNFAEELKLIEAMRAYRVYVLAQVKASSSGTDATKLKTDAVKANDEAEKVKAALDKKAGAVINAVMGSLEQAMSRLEQRLRFALDTASEPVKTP